MSAHPRCSRCGRPQVVVYRDWRERPVGLCCIAPVDARVQRRVDDIADPGALERLEKFWRGE